jgi:hypothetical protein
VLICIFSLALQSSVSLNIHNHCQDINLISPIYFIRGGKWHVIPEQKIDMNAVVRNHFESDSGQDILEGALVYRIQRQHAESGGFVRDESKSIQFLVAWHIEHTQKLCVRALLVENDRELDEDKLIKLHQKYWHLLDEWVNPIGSNWLLNDTTALATSVKVMNGDYRWDIFISGGTKDNIKRPLWIDVER